MLPSPIEADQRGQAESGPLGFLVVKKEEPDLLFLAHAKLNQCQEQDGREKTDPMCNRVTHSNLLDLLLPLDLVLMTGRTYWCFSKHVSLCNRLHGNAKAGELHL